MSTTHREACQPAIADCEPQDAEALFEEAKRRERHRRLTWSGSFVALAAAGLLAYSFGTASPTSPALQATSGLSTSPARSSVQMLDCAGRPVYKPSTFVISCADANSELTATHWSSWTTRVATGSTRFGLNLCDPYCAASRITFFPRSVVRLSGPKSTRRGRLFSELVVTYRLHGKRSRFVFSWSGDPSFAK